LTKGKEQFYALWITHHDDIFAFYLIVGDLGETPQPAKERSVKVGCFLAVHFNLDIRFASLVTLTAQKK
jgi:hypothetical protein